LRAHEAIVAKALASWLTERGLGERIG
jgi:hypothetical protein